MKENQQKNETKSEDRDKQLQDALKLINDERQQRSDECFKELIEVLERRKCVWIVSNTIKDNNQIVNNIVVRAI